MHDHTNGATLLREGHDDVFAGEGFWDELDDGRGNLDLAKLDEGEAVLFGLGLHDVVHIDVAQLDEGFFDRPLHAAGFLELIRTDHAATDEDLGPIPSFGHD